MACRIFVTALHSFGPLSLPSSASFIHHSSALASDVEGKPALFLISATFNFAPLFFSAFGSTFTFLHSLRLWVSKFLMSWKKNFIRIWLFSTNWFQGWTNRTSFAAFGICFTWPPADTSQCFRCPIVFCQPPVATLEDCTYPQGPDT